jgi:hypothetical protein
MSDKQAAGGVGPYAANGHFPVPRAMNSNPSRSARHLNYSLFTIHSSFLILLAARNKIAAVFEKNSRHTEEKLL